MIRRFTDAEDSLIRTYWLSTPSRAIGFMMVPPRNGSDIRVRARRLGLPQKPRSGPTGARPRRTKRPYPPHVIAWAQDFLEWRGRA